jgi:hypothetical protein
MPVCGCNNTTYINEGCAQMAGERVAHTGACGSTDGGRFDGGFNCFSNAQCPATDFCDAVTCGGPGRCTPRARPCSMFEVCGCDGNTYAAACVASADGVRIAHPGPCGVLIDGAVDALPPQDSGPGDANPGVCFTDSQCGPSALCFAIGCGTPGTCIMRPTSCPGIDFPTCGCDGTTYANPCYALMNGARIANLGACAEEGGLPDGFFVDAGGGFDGGVFDGSDFDAGVFDAGAPPDAATDAIVIDDVPISLCTSSATCAANQYCAHLPTSPCGGVGLCIPRPVRCGNNVRPVCTCDGRTYLNACRAAQAGENVESTGVCR